MIRGICVALFCVMVTACGVDKYGIGYQLTETDLENAVFDRYNLGPNRVMYNFLEYQDDEGIRYSLLFSKQKVVVFIKTYDEGFQSPEGYVKGQSVADLDLELAVYIDRVGYSIPLSDGWYAVSRPKDEQNPSFEGAVINYFYRK